MRGSSVEQKFPCWLCEMLMYFAKPLRDGHSNLHAAFRRLFSGMPNVRTVAGPCGLFPPRKLRRGGEQGSTVYSRQSGEQAGGGAGAHQAEMFGGQGFRCGIGGVKRKGVGGASFIPWPIIMA